MRWQCQTIISPSLTPAQMRSAVAGISTCAALRRARWRSAFMIAGGAAVAPASPVPLAPAIGLAGDPRCSTEIVGIVSARGMRVVHECAGQQLAVRIVDAASLSAWPSPCTSRRAPARRRCAVEHVAAIADRRVADDFDARRSAGSISTSAMWQPLGKEGGALTRLACRCSPAITPWRTSSPARSATSNSETRAIAR